MGADQIVAYWTNPIAPLASGWITLSTASGKEC